MELPQRLSSRRRRAGSMSPKCRSSTTRVPANQSCSPCRRLAAHAFLLLLSPLHVFIWPGFLLFGPLFRPALLLGWARRNLLALSALPCASCCWVCKLLVLGLFAKTYARHVGLEAESPASRFVERCSRWRRLLVSFVLGLLGPLWLPALFLPHGGNA